MSCVEWYGLKDIRDSGPALGMARAYIKENSGRVDHADFTSLF
jgi:hypothetical protein